MNQLTALLIVVLLYGCGRADRYENSIVSQIYDVHEQALIIEKDIRPTYQKLLTLKDVLLEQQTPLTEQEIKLIRQVEAIETSYATWVSQQEQVEPKMASLGTNDRISQSNSSAYPVEDMLFVQKEFMENILTIQRRIDKLNQMLI